MSVRTTSDAVKDLLGDHYNGRSSLTGFIATASSLVDWLASKDSDSELDSTALELIERWLACHFYEHSDQMLSSKSTGGAGGSFQGQTGMVLLSTKYGATACALDVTGRLAQRSKEAETGQRCKVSMSWLGKPPSDQIDYEDRD